MLGSAHERNQANPTRRRCVDFDQGGKCPSIVTARTYMPNDTIAKVHVLASVEAFCPWDRRGR